jgi:hypothetical protein
MKYALNIKWYYFLLLSSTAVLLFIQIPAPLSFLFDPDEGYHLCNALMVQKGLHPFIDFQTGPYGPLNSYIGAAFQYLSNSTLLGELSLCFLGYFISYFIIYRILIKLKLNSTLSLIVVLMFVFIMPRYYKYFIVLAPALFLYSIINYIQSKNENKSILYLGLSCSLMGLFRIDYGIYGIITSFFVFLLFRNEIKIIKTISYWFLSVIFFPLCWIIFLIFKTDISNVINFTYSYITGASEGLSLPFPSVTSLDFLSKSNSFFFIFWFFFLLPYLSLAFFFYIRKSISVTERIFIPALILFSCLIFIQALHRTDASHLLQVAVIQLILIAWIINYFLNKKLKELFVISVIFISFYLCCLPFSLINKNSLFRNCIMNHNEKINAYCFSKPELICYYNSLLNNDSRKWIIDVISFTNNNTLTKDAVCFLPLIPQLYYFTNKSLPLPTSIFFPGMPNDIHTQNLYIGALKKNKVKTIITIPDFYFDNLKKRNIKNYFPYFFDYINNNYPIKTKMGEAEILQITTK